MLTSMHLPISTAERESMLLASYAMFSERSRGRVHPESEQLHRGPYQRDRDRIVHSTAFRRLSGKMQVFTGDMGDYHRTRLTHTQEVASIARTLGRALRLNEDLVEALALFHDIGHPPFGHAGEDALDECLHDCGGFSHNRFALTIAEELEHPYGQFVGLNLTCEVLDSQATRIDKSTNEIGPLLEAQVVEAADSVTYNAHDADDAMKLGIVTLDDLRASTLGREVVDALRAQYTNVEPEIMRRMVARELIDRQARDILEHTSEYLFGCEGCSAEEVRKMPFRVGTSPGMSQRKRELEHQLYCRVYRHPDLMRVRTAAQQRIRRLFETYCRRVDLLPANYRDRAEVIGVPRTVGDYIGCMTDRFCDQEYARLFPGKKS